MDRRLHPIMKNQRWHARSALACVFAMTAGLALAAGPLRAEPATLHVTASDRVGTLRPNWHVSRRVRADITEANLYEGTLAGDTMQRWVQDDVGCPSGDDAGHFVGNRLGGIGTLYKNIFPENLNLNRGRQRAWEGRVVDYLVNECTEVRVTIAVTFSDADPETRPVSVRYSTRCVGDVIDGGRRSLPTQDWPNDLPAGCP